MQAKFLADQLTDQGIPAMSDTHDLHDALGSMSSGPRVWVRAETSPGPALAQDYEAAEQGRARRPRCLRHGLHEV